MSQRHLFFLFFVVVAGCSKLEDERLASKVSLAATQSGDEIAALFSSSSNLPQLLSVTTGSLQGSSVLIPPGSLSIDLSVTVSSTQSIANASQAADLGIASVVFSAAGPSVLVSPSTNVELSVPMQLSIPISSVNLALVDETENYVIVYKGYVVKDGATTYSSGLIPRSEIVINNGFAKFRTTHFGAFQVAKTSTKVEQAIVQPSTTEIGKLPGYELVGGWRACQVDSSPNSTSGHDFETFTFLKTGALVHEDVVASNYCETPYDAITPKLRVVHAAIYDVGGIFNATLPDGHTGDVRAIDIRITGITVTVYDEQILADFNANKNCGVTWVAGVATAITDGACLNPNPTNGGGDGGPNIGGTVLGIYNVSSSKFLFQDEDGKTGSVGIRPTAFLSNSTFNKI